MKSVIQQPFKLSLALEAVKLLLLLLLLEAPVFAKAASCFVAGEIPRNAIARTDARS